MQCKELEAVLEQDGFSPLPSDAREHLASCTACQGLLADLTTIVATANQIPADVTPPDRLWISLSAQLRAEGIIKEQEPLPVEVTVQPSWWQNLSAAFRPRALATAAIGIALAVGVYFQNHKTAAPTPETTVPVAKSESVPSAEPAKEQEQIAAPAATTAAQNVVAQQAKSPAPSLVSSDLPLLPSPSELAATTLMNVEQDVPNMQLAGNSAVDTSLRQNLRTLNEFIVECQQRLKQNPQDALAREYLYSAYQQKAELLSAMMESGRSEH
jgi:hypothetical protein